MKQTQMKNDENEMNEDKNNNNSNSYKSGAKKWNTLGVRSMAFCDFEVRIKPH